MTATNTDRLLAMVREMEEKANERDDRGSLMVTVFIDDVLALCYLIREVVAENERLRIDLQNWRGADNAE